MSHISSYRPSLWSAMNRISQMAGGCGAGRRTVRAACAAANTPEPAGALINPPKSSTMNCRARVRKLSTPGQRLSRRNNLLTIGSICSVISPDCIHNVDNPQAPTWLRPRSQASRLALPALAGSGQGEAGENDPDRRFRLATRAAASADVESPDDSRDLIERQPDWADRGSGH